VLGYLNREGFSVVGGNNPSNTNPLLLNLGQVSYFDTQQMFINIAKQAGSNDPLATWIPTVGTGAGSTGEEQYVQYDSDGYVKSLTASPTPGGGQVFTAVGSAIFVNMATIAGVSVPYPSGSYTLQAQGAGTWVFGADVQSGSLATSSPNISVSGLTITSTASSGVTWAVTFNIPTPSSGGIRFWITAISGTNYFKAVTICQSSLLSSLNGGSIFHPNFLTALQTAPWKVLRFMDTLVTNHQLIGGSSGFLFDLTLVSANTGATSVTLKNQTQFPWLPGTYTVTFSTGQVLTATTTAGSAVLALSGAITGSPSSYVWAQLQTNWSDRPQVSNYAYTTDKGVPYEICLALCTLVSANAWIPIPAGTGSSYWNSLATLILANLPSSQKVYLEYSNEPWNGSFATFSWSRAVSPAILGGTTDGAQYVGAQTALLADQFATVYGSPAFDNQVVVSMPGQAASTGYMTDALSTPNWPFTVPWQRTSGSGQKTIKSGHIAPYIGQGNILAADFTHLTGQGDGGYTDFFASLTANPVNGYTFSDPNGPTALPAGGWCGEAAAWVTNHVSAMASFGHLPIVCYEGGWQFTAAGSGSGQQTFLVTASRDARMKAALDTYFVQMAAAGTVLPAQFDFCDPYGTFQWGLIESVMQTMSPITSAPPKLQGAVEYV